jgi:hypothetical protein
MKTQTALLIVGRWLRGEPVEEEKLKAAVTLLHTLVASEFNP